MADQPSGSGWMSIPGGRHGGKRRRRGGKWEYWYPKDTSHSARRAERLRVRKETQAPQQATPREAVRREVAKRERERRREMARSMNDRKAKLAAQPPSEVSPPPQRGIVTAEDRRVANQLVNLEAGRAVHKAATETILRVDAKLRAWDKDLSKRRTPEQRMAALEEILDFIDEDLPEEPDPILHHGLRFKGQEAAILERAYNLMGRAVSERKRKLQDLQPGEFASMKRRFRSSGSGFGIGLPADGGLFVEKRDALIEKSSGLGPPQAFTLFNPNTPPLGNREEDIRKRFAEQIADVARLPQAHRDHFQRARTEVHVVIDASYDSMWRSAQAGIHGARPVVTMFEGGLDEASAMEIGAVLVHELGHVMEFTTDVDGSDFVEGHPPKAEARETLDYADRQHAEWGDSKAEILAEAYRYAYADGGPMETTLTEDSLDLAEVRRWFDRRVTRPDLPLKIKRRLDQGRAFLQKSLRRLGFRKSLPGALPARLGPPPTPNREEHPYQATAYFQGITVYIENVKGSTRSGKGWSVKMKAHYGEIPGTIAYDGDPIDVYLGDDHDAPMAYIVRQLVVSPDQHNAPFDYDEDKVFLGFGSEDEVRAMHAAHFDVEIPDPQITAMPVAVLRQRLAEGEGSLGAALP